MFYSIGSNPFSNEFHSAAQGWGLIVEKGLLKVHLSK